MAKLNKEQLKKLYDYGGTLSPKDWADLIDNLPDGSETPKYDDSGTVIETTYEEAKALYESGKMIPGVRYKFEYRHKLIYDDSTNWLPDKLTLTQFNNFDIQIYINKNNELKAAGCYIVNNQIKYFTSDYSFEPKYDNIIVNFEDGDYPISFVSSFGIHSIIIPKEYENVTMIENWINTNCNVVYRGYTNMYDPTNIGYMPGIHFILDDVIVHEASIDDSDSATIQTRKGDYITYGINYDESQLSPEINTTNIDTTGCLFNLDFGDHKHSFIVDGYYNYYDNMTRDGGPTGDPFIVNATVIQNEFELLFKEAPFSIKKGLIINSTFYLSDWTREEISGGYTKVYAIDNYIVFDSDGESFGDNIIIEPESYGETIYVGLE